MKKFNWLYQIRGMAIIAVVVCHQQGLLHQSEWVQLLSLYSVTTMIFCMGLTQSFSLRNSKNKFADNDKYLIFNHTMKKITPIILSYVVVSIAYLSQLNYWTGIENNILFDYLITFSASPPLYFLRYYIALTIISPFIYVIINNIIYKKQPKIASNIELVLLLIITFFIGYITIDKLNFLGQSYLFVYTAGLIIGSKPLPKIRNIQLPFILFILGFGLWSMKQFYWARVAGDYAYAGGIDKYVSKLQMNPPNLSIIIYSLGCILMFYWIFNKIDMIELKIHRFFLIPFKLLMIIGKYSLDVFMWHLFIQRLLTWYVDGFMPNIWVKRIVFYSAMLFIPVVARLLYEKIKKYTYVNFRNIENI